MPADDRSAGLALAFEQGERAIQEQARTLDAVRTRAGLVFSAAAVMGGVLAGFVVGDRTGLQGAWGWAGVVAGGAAFAAVLAVTVAVSWPTEMNVNHDPWVIVESYVDADPPATLDETHRWLAYHRHADIEANAASIERRMYWLVAGLCAVLVELAGLIVAVAAAAR